MKMERDINNTHNVDDFEKLCSVIRKMENSTESLVESCDSQMDSFVELIENYCNGFQDKSSTDKALTVMEVVKNYEWQELSTELAELKKMFKKTSGDNVFATTDNEDDRNSDTSQDNETSDVVSDYSVCEPSLVDISHEENVDDENCDAEDESYTISNTSIQSQD